MANAIDKIKEDALSRIQRQNDVDVDALYYVDHRVFEKKERLDVVSDKIDFEQNSVVVFVDLQPGMNWAHPCKYLIYDAQGGKFLKQIDAQFPYFIDETPTTLELFKTSGITDRFKKKRRLSVPLEPKTLSGYLKLATFPLHFYLVGTRYAILYSGASNCRHVNDMEFLYRTLIDVYGFNAADIYVLNRDGTLSWNPAGNWEPAVSGTYPVDGTPFRMTVFDEGNRAGFQAAVADLATKMTSRDCLFIHTNNHGGWDSVRNEAYMSGWGGSYYASEMVADLGALPHFHTLLAMMEPCHSGGFVNPLVTANLANRTVAQAAVPWNQNSAGGWFFDPWAEMWISAIAGVRGDGSTLAVSPDDNLDSKISAAEAYDYALSIDNPVMEESSAGISDEVWLSQCRKSSKLKEYKEFKEYKEYKEIKEHKEHKEVKEFKELEPKQFEPKQFEPKQYEPKGFEPKGYEPKGFETGGFDPAATPPVEDVGSRLVRLERAVERLRPFIQEELRPNLFTGNKSDDKGKGKGKGKSKGKG